MAWPTGPAAAHREPAAAVAGGGLKSASEHYMVLSCAIVTSQPGPLRVRVHHANIMMIQV